MTGVGAGSAAGRLRRRRRELALTQQELAEASGVSERSIRELEAGRLTRPHRATLEALGAALGHESYRLRGFIQSWEVGWLVPRPEDLDGFAPPVPYPWWPDGARFSALKSAVAHQHVEFSADGRRVRVRDFRIVEALADDVSDFRFFRPTQPGEARTDLQDVVGGHTLDVDRGSHLLSLHVELDRVLATGDLAPLELNYVVERQDGAAPMTRYSAGFLYPPTIFTCTVRFLGESPSSAWRVEGHSMQDVERVSSIEHGHDRDTVTLVATHPRSPVVGIAWEW
ncbi:MULTISPECIES: helix-turn-helix domain-containing protein [unclassified Knoellia]|uniref:helix-turn-helix domain-containing protein n=1 Tax=Knoellia altitudinis TaxID=3404795 RepID=UPI003620068D